ncbi:MAG: DUF4926 domain-containing protein [Alkalinema sp. CAN_BIN05]|nr:DUF4926 domain-containing protein [Alkalinema sp. CAN_BIN05]
MIESLVKIKLLDVVALNTSLPEHNLLVGQVGTIVKLLAPDVYEVEFSDDQRQTYAISPLHNSQIIRLHYQAPEFRESLLP